MEYALVASRTFILGLKLHCKGCEAKVKRKLLSIQGVHTVSIDSKKGHITITGTIDPPTLISILEKYSKKAVLLWEQPPPPQEASTSSVDGDSYTDEKGVQIISENPKTIDQFEDSNVAETIQQLARGVKDLKEIEVTISKTVKVVFNDGKMEVVETTNSITTGGKDGKVVMNNESMATREEKTVIGTPYFGSGTCCCQFSGQMHNHNDHWQAPGGGFATPLGRGQPWASSIGVPAGHQYDLPPSYYPQDQSVFSDDNPNGCVVM